MTEPTSTTRSPLTAPPLRNPGQSLDEEIHRLLNEEVIGSVGIVAAFLIITLLEWMRWWQNHPPRPLLYTAITVAVIGHAARKLFMLRRQLRQLRLARDGERAVGQYLETLRARGYRVLHDLVGDGFNVDHVLIGAAGIFTIETKTRRKPAKGTPEVVYDGERVTVAGHVPDRDPIAQARAQAHWLQNLLLESTGQRFEVQPVVLYPGWFVKTIAKPGRGDPWVLNPKALPAFLEHRPNPLSTVNAQLATYHLSRFVRIAAH